MLHSVASCRSLLALLSRQPPGERGKSLASLLRYHAMVERFIMVLLDDQATSITYFSSPSLWYVRTAAWLCGLSPCVTRRSAFPVRVLLSRVQIDRLLRGLSKVGDPSGRLITTVLRNAQSKDRIDCRNYVQQMPCPTLG
jgi:hypothetical protein